MEKRERIGRKEFINRFGFEGVHNSENSGESERLVPLSRWEKERERKGDRVSPRWERLVDEGGKWAGNTTAPPAAGLNELMGSYELSSSKFPPLFFTYKLKFLSGVRCPLTSASSQVSRSVYDRVYYVI